MWSMMKHRISADWKILLAWNSIVFCLLLFQQNTFMKFHYEDSFPQVNFKSIFLLGLIVLFYLMLYMGMQYVDYDGGKTRWLLLRKHKLTFFLGDVLVLFLQLVLFYLMAYFLIRAGISRSIDEQFPKATLVLKNMLFEKALESNAFTTRVLVMNLWNVGANLLVLLSVSMWVHCCAIVLQQAKKTWQSVASFLSIFPILASLLTLCSTVLICLLVGFFYFYLEVASWNIKNIHV